MYKLSNLVALNPEDKIIAGLKVAGHTGTRLFELDGYGHGMTKPAFPLLLREVERIAKLKLQSR